MADVFSFRTILFSFLSIITVADLNAQNVSDVSLAKQKTPVYSEAQKADKWNAVNNCFSAAFTGSSDRIQREVPSQVFTDKPSNNPEENKWEAFAWRGEKIHNQIALASKDSLKDLFIRLTDLTDKTGNKISATNITTGFLGFVMTDEFRNGCGYRKPEDFDSSMVADLIDTRKSTISVGANSGNAIWLSIAVPATMKAGVYNGLISVNQPLDKGDSTLAILKIEVNVIDRTLPSPDQWSYQLDLWQHPAAIARTDNVPLWSEAHFKAMRPYYTMLAKAGQKCITTSIVNEPWGHQTYDDYPGLIKWTKKKNGTWSYDYSLFDKYVEFVMSCGITGRINCYSMVPWKIAFTYFDEAKGKEAVVTEAIGTPAYNAFWKPMLVDFAAHLKTKGWFSKTAIAMDERPMPAMESVIKLLRSIDKDWKISLAGEYHPEIEKDIYDYCVASKWTFPADVLARRKKEGKYSTWYTCCAEKYPNGFSFSPPDEHVWMGWYTAATAMEGYLRWAFNSWVEKPFTDSRFRTWPAGDTYQIYPGALSSIRFEKLIEGVQDYEKIRILKASFIAAGDQSKLAELEKILSEFKIEKLSSVLASDMVADAKKRLNAISK